MSHYGRGNILGAASDIAQAAIRSPSSSGPRIAPYQSSFSAGTTHRSSGPQGIHPLCLDYFHFLALYYPEERARLGEALITYTNADAAIIDECAISLYEEMLKIAKARGVSVQDIKREFRELKKSLAVPDAQQLNKMKTPDAEKELLASYSHLGYPTPEARTWLAQTTSAARDGDAIAMSELEETSPGRTESFGRRAQRSRSSLPMNRRAPRWWLPLQKAQMKRQQGHLETAQRIDRRGISLFGWTPRG